MKRVTAVRPVLLGLTACVAAWALLGCVSAQRSSRDLLTENQSSAVIAVAQPEVFAAITMVLNARGFALVDQRPLADGGAVYKFKGSRLGLTVHEYGGPLGAVHLGSDSAEIGSVFFVRLLPRGATATEVYILGKPTVDGAEMCTPFDLPVFGCTRVRAAGWPGRDAATGREEAAMVRALLEILRRQAGRTL